jgi:hypothetical protein
MRSSHICFRVGYLFFSLFTAGCASQYGWNTQSAPADFVDGSRVLAEVVFIATRENVLSNNGLMQGLRDKLISAGYTDNDIVDGSEVTVSSYCYRWNSGGPTCTHHGHYVAHVPAELREGLHGISGFRTAGDLVEIELVKTPNGYLVGNVVAVYRKSEDWSPCRAASLQQTAVMATLLGVGPPKATWIECENIESEGWIRRPVLGAPSSAGPPISEWVKL